MCRRHLESEVATIQPTQDVEYSSFVADGALGSWPEVEQMPQPRIYDVNASTRRVPRPSSREVEDRVADHPPSSPTPLLEGKRSTEVHIRQFVSQQGSVALLRDKVLEARSELDFERSRLEHLKRFERESIDRIIHIIEETVDRISLGRSSDELRELRELQDQYKADAIVVEEHQASIMQLSNALNNLDYRLMIAEQVANTTLVELIPSIGIDADDIKEAENTAVLSDTSSSDSPSLLVRYYDRQGDVGVFNERLMELDYNYREEVAHRDFFAEHSQPPSISNDEFERDYSQRRQFILAEIAAAESDAKTLAKSCTEAGFDIPGGEAVLGRFMGQDVAYMSAHKVPGDVTSIRQLPSRHLSDARGVFEWIRSLPDHPLRKTVSEP